MHQSILVHKLKSIWGITRTDRLSLSTFDLKAGKHMLRATVIGANETPETDTGD